MLTLCRLVTIARSLQNILWSSEVAGVHVRSNAPYVRRRTPRVHGAALTNVVSTTREFPPAYLGPALECVRAHARSSFLHFTDASQETVIHPSSLGHPSTNFHDELMTNS
jgi:hypothetical protein